MINHKKRNFAILGAGRQGTAVAYDLVKFGNPSKVLICDIDQQIAQKSAHRVNQLLNTDLVEAQQVDVTQQQELLTFLTDINTVISAVPYYHNLNITKAAIAAKTNMCDLGGNTELVMKQLELYPQAKASNISVIPDCGQVPGMGTTLCVYAMSFLEKPEELFMWDGGIPQSPRPPFNYLLTFNIEGLINEYYGTTEFLRDGRIVEIPCFVELEEIEFPPPIGSLEAFTTAGGTSTAPRTFEGQLKTFQNKTIRHPGHYTQLKTMNDLGLFAPNEIKIGAVKVKPRDVLAKLFEPKITFPNDKDIVVIRVKCIGEKNNRPAQVQLDLIDYYDEVTGFTAMERTTGWDISIVAIMMADNQSKKGAVPLELAISSTDFVKELRRREIQLNEQITFLDE
jgi:lysine 6-dehydrogenase